MKHMKSLLAAVLCVCLFITGLSICAYAKTVIKLGDANNDDSVDMKDVLLVRKNIAGMDATIDVLRADANRDEAIDMKDVLLIRKGIAQMVELSTYVLEDSQFVSDPESQISEEPSEEPSEQPSEEPSTEPIEESEVSLPDAPVNVGDILTLGKYEQDNNLDNGGEDIEWIVVDYDYEKEAALCISRYVLERVRYNQKYTRTSWEACTLRAWCNDTFYNGAFNEEEKKQIVTVKNVNEPNPMYGYSSGPDTIDNVFVPSFSEARNILGEKYMASALTPYLEAKFAATQEDPDYARYWLRTIGSSSDFDSAGYCYVSGGMASGGHGVTYDDCARPMIWISKPLG